MVEERYPSTGEYEDEDPVERAAAYDRWVSNVLRPTLEHYRERQGLAFLVEHVCTGETVRL